MIILPPLVSKFKVSVGVTQTNGIECQYVTLENILHNVCRNTECSAFSHS